jgi:hypothetical protein
MIMELTLAWVWALNGLEEPLKEKVHYNSVTVVFFFQG